MKPCRMNNKKKINYQQTAVWKKKQWCDLKGKKKLSAKSRQ